MIRRIVEYIITCDNEDECRDPGGHAYGWESRKEAIEKAPQHGWVRLTRGRWVCKRCAERLFPPQQLEALNKRDTDS